MKKSASSNLNSKTCTSKFLCLLNVCRKIKDIKQYTVDEGQKMNESLKNYQMAFEKKLKNLHDELTEKFRTEQEYQDAEIKRGYERLKYLDDEVVREREDRIRALDDLLAPIEDQIAQNNRDLDEERNQRVTNERMILDNLATDAKKIEDTIL